MGIGISFAKAGHDTSAYARRPSLRRAVCSDGAEQLGPRPMTAGPRKRGNTL
jgi:hypothetical protein